MNMQFAYTIFISCQACHDLRNLFHNCYFRFFIWWPRQ